MGASAISTDFDPNFGWGAGCLCLFKLDNSFADTTWGFGDFSGFVIFNSRITNILSYRVEKKGWLPPFNLKTMRWSFHRFLPPCLISQLSISLQPKMPELRFWNFDQASKYYLFAGDLNLRAEFLVGLLHILFVPLVYHLYFGDQNQICLWARLLNCSKKTWVNHTKRKYRSFLPFE